MSKNNKDNKGKSMGKFVIGSSLALLIIFASILGATYFITKAAMPDEDFVKLHLGEQEVGLEEVLDMTVGAKALAEETDDTTDETTDDSDDTELTSSNETRAKIIETEFYSLALFGTSDYQTLNRAGEYGGLLFSTEDDENSYNIPESFIQTEGEGKDKAVNYKKNFIISKLFKETYDSSVFKYLETFSDENDDITPLLEQILELTSEGVPVAEGATASIPIQFTYNELVAAATAQGKTDLLDAIVEALTTDLDYQSEVFEEMYTYTYLWQDSTSRMYDYNFTQALVKARPSIVAEANIDIDKAGLGNTVIAGLQDKVEGDTVTSSEWDDLLAEDFVKDTDKTNSIVPESFNGFKGIQFGTTDNTSIKEDFYDAAKTWDVKTLNTEADKSITTTGDYSNEDVLKTANYYIADKSEGVNGDGAIVQSEDQNSFGILSGDATVTAFSQLYPFMFATIEGTGANEVVTSPYFSLYANESTGEGGATTFTRAEKGEGTTYIFDRWFTEAYSALGEIYVSEELIGYDSGLKTTGLDYWNDEGYYIELSGTSADNFLSYLPTNILKKD